MSAPHSAKILVLGASGLIGGFTANDLMRRGFPVIAVARKFAGAQRHSVWDSVRECPVGDYSADQLADLLRETEADVVVNCLGLLQAVPGEGDIHDAFVARLLAAMKDVKPTALLVDISIPGADTDDHTDFAITKRNADRRIVASGLSYVILRPGFVFAPPAYGGSALLRALAMSPFDLPRAESERPFAAVAVEDIAETVAFLVARVEAGETTFAAVWDLMHPEKITVGGVVAALRRWFGVERSPRVTMPEFLLDLGAWAGDFAALLGWRPAVRSTAIAELRRGVAGDPQPWMTATGIAPRALADILRQRPATVQEQWFAQLYLLKALMIVALAIFWCVSGAIALAFSFKPAADILIAHGFSTGMANAATLLSSLMDICVGLTIAFRRTSRAGLMAGICLSLFYMIGAALLTPELWIEPLGALVKTGPAIVLMLVALAISGDR